MSKTINVGLAEAVVSSSPDILLCLALGSCVAIVLYDFKSKIGGLAHVMLPRSNETKTEHSPGKFANTAIEFVLREMLRKGSSKEHIKAKIVGGAHMFSGKQKSFHGISDSIGARNIYAIRQILFYEGIAIEAEDTGDNYARSVNFFLDSGRLVVKSFRKGTKDL
jgi:chemotaxis protein CheD